MKNPKIENVLREWAKDMVSRYDWLTILFEYSEYRRHYWCRTIPSSASTSAMSSALRLPTSRTASTLNTSTMPPLFCDDERLFRLSPNAETIIKPTLNMVAVGEELVRHLEL